MILPSVRSKEHLFYRAFSSFIYLRSITSAFLVHLAINA